MCFYNILLFSFFDDDNRSLSMFRFDLLNEHNVIVVYSLLYLSPLVHMPYAVMLL